MIDYKIKNLEERIQFQEQNVERKIFKLEERLKQINQKFDRIESLGDRLESLNNLFDQLKSNFDAKLQVFDDKISHLTGKIGKLKIDNTQQLYQIIKKSFEEANQDFSKIKAQGYKKSEAQLRQSNIMDLQKNDRLRSITQEKNQNEEDVQKKLKCQMMDKFQFTLQTKQSDDTQILTESNKISNKKLETLTLESSSILDQTQSHDPINSKLKHTNSTIYIREQLKNLRK
ncbi:unnamed protein product [Paramecium primaurelia]|uniref:Uncharacterized protein n=2 Tax=Paramecium TaxID=5884 RepID=A0A8S1XH22_9CILI|nr:unnamed protein product [Paramecium primaurelia]CAD8199962.1 unnamed protein product [Paramecium pentaurelia]